MRGRAAVAAILRGGGAGGLAVVEPRTVPAVGGEAMLEESSKANACGRAAASAASESYTGRGSSTSGWGGRVERTPRYTLGLLQTPRSTADSTGDFSSGGVRPGSSSGEGLAPSRAAGASRVKPPVPGRGGGVRLSGSLILFFYPPALFAWVGLRRSC